MRPEAPILRHFKMIHDYVEREGNAQLKTLGLTLAQGHMLRILKHSKECTASLKELECCMKVAQSTTAGMASRLEHNGFVHIYSDSQDKRIKLVELTEKGLEATGGVKNSMQEIDNSLFTDLTSEEMETLKALLKKVTDSINKESEHNRRTGCQE